MKDFLRAIPVWLFGLLAFIAGALLAWALSPTLGRRLTEVIYTGRPALWIVGLASVLNAVFEEFIWLGFAVNVPGSRRLAPALAWSVIPRCAVHLYQGWKGLFLVGPLGLWYFRYYWRTGRLWPVIIAHALQDVVVLTILARRHAG
jgi:membrane protease YdiL (CAAX protease family)